MQTNTFIADIQRSSVIWTGKKVLGKHTGTIDMLSGKFELKGTEVLNGLVIFDVGSISSTDIKDAKTNAQLVGHLLSDDFFGVEKFPTASFSILSADHQSDDVYLISGELTIKGITAPNQFPVTLRITGGILSVTGEVSVNRTLFGIKYGSGNFFSGLGDNMINNDFTIDFTLIGKTIS